MAGGRELRYDTRDNRPRWMLVVLWLILVMSVAQVAVSWLRWGLTGVTVVGLCWLAWVLLLLVVLTVRTEIVVDALGVRRRPYLPRIEWGNIAAVSRPRPTDEYVRLVSTRGRRRVPIGIPASYAQEVARIGGKELRD